MAVAWSYKLPYTIIVINIHKIQPEEVTLSGPFQVTEQTLEYGRITWNKITEGFCSAPSAILKYELAEELSGNFWEQE